jgi:hypothetical protein
MDLPVHPGLRRQPCRGVIFAGGPRVLVGNGVPDVGLATPDFLRDAVADISIAAHERVAANLGPVSRLRDWCHAVLKQL